MSMKLLSRGETNENNSYNNAITDGKKTEQINENAFLTEYIISYEIEISTPEDSLAKTYEDKNEMIVTLEVPKADYKNENIQKLLRWAEAPIYDKNYYRDIAVNVNISDTYERTIVFTHAEISVSEETKTDKDFVTMIVIINQKMDKYAGVVFGDEIEETYKKAWKKVLNQLSLNIYIPLKIEERNKEYALITTSYNAKFYKNNNFEYSAETDEYGRAYKNEKFYKSINEILNEGYRFCGEEEDGFILGTKTYKFNKELSEMYVEENGKREYLGTGYIIKEKVNGINCAVNYAINPQEVFAKLNYKMINNEESYYTIEGKNGEFQINKVKEKYIKQNGTFYLNNIKMSDLINILKDDITYTWDYLSKKLIIIIKEEIREEIEIAPWLKGYKGRPNKTGGRSVTYVEAEWNKLKEINDSIDWYSYENQTAPNGFVLPYLGDQEYVIGNYGELMDKDRKYYWVTLGPKVLIPNYPDEGKLLTEDFKDHIGCRIDVVLHNDKNGMYVYIECLFSGNIKAHTFNNGIYQTGHPYPNSVSAKLEPYNIGYVNGSFIEFTGKDPGNNGTMSQYSLVEIIVYPK